MHTRIRKFNTRDTYPEQRLDNDLCQAVVARGRTVFVRGQVGQNLDTAVNVGVGDPRRRRSGRWPNIKQLLDEAGAESRAYLQGHDLSDRPALSRGRLSDHRPLAEGIFPVSTGIVVAGLARPEWLVEIDVIAVIPDEA